MKIGIYPDDYTNSATPENWDASSPRWADLLEMAGHNVKWVNVHRPDFLEQLDDCDGFMWRWAHFRGMGRIARRLLPIIEKELGLVVYPNQNTCWYYDDKISQAYLFQALQIPSPATWVCFSRDVALEFLKKTQYPVVLKLFAGAGSTNVKLLHSYDEGILWVDRLFSQWVRSLDDSDFQNLNLVQRLRWATRIIREGTLPKIRDNGLELHSGYIIFQKFLTENPFDTRITVIGNRAFGFRRFNRDNDFRASGSGKIDWDPNAVDMNFVRLAYIAARKLSSQSCAIDGLYQDGECVVGEVSYAYASWAVYRCPGHWELVGSDPINGELRWVDGHVWPEEAQVEDFLAKLRGSKLGKQ